MQRIIMDWKSYGKPASALSSAASTWTLCVLCWRPQNVTFSTNAPNHLYKRLQKHNSPLIISISNL